MAGQGSDATSHENSPFVFVFQTFPACSTLDGAVAWEEDSSRPIVFMRNGNGGGDARLSQFPLCYYVHVQVKLQQ